jgi:hypothetical protein
VVAPKLESSGDADTSESKPAAVFKIVTPLTLSFIWLIWLLVVRENSKFPLSVTEGGFVMSLILNEIWVVVSPATVGN